MKDSYTELKGALCRTLSLESNVSDNFLIDAVQRCADAAKQSETDTAKRAAAEAHEKEIQKILKQAGGALKRDQAEQILSDRAASSAASERM
ncbi:MAG TPA: hypothetical protein VH280_17805 [Verrucomicrobiae bacterium]|jgi:hypothetical protein|nr:hypothetical protein [Verrucomicrobiae bacterium]